jgi:hypothetical protein
MLEIQNSKLAHEGKFETFPRLDFEFVSDFGFRISDFSLSDAW